MVILGYFRGIGAENYFFPNEITIYYINTITTL
jgi:hypothetical protein